MTLFRGLAMRQFRFVPPLLVVGLVGACARPVPMSHRFMAVPTTEKTQVAFRHDIKIYRQQAQPSQKDGVPAKHERVQVNGAGMWVVSKNSRFLQCLSARGNAVAPAPDRPLPGPCLSR